ncbi:MAG: 50S ribosomal protein L11 methyltransferase [Oscillospiraceae bacterium]|nr:50S ribosomal protein L11 methyltransferase [Oscillospiraceae bacterium]
MNSPFDKRRKIPPILKAGGIFIDKIYKIGHNEYMEFIKLNIFTVREDLEPLMSRLEDMGVSGFEIHDAADFADFLEDGVRDWDYVGEELEPLKTQETHLTLYLTTDKQGGRLLGKVRRLCAGLRIEQSTVREEDWADCWKEYFKPFKVGERFIIKPSWENIADIKEYDADLILEIDPATAFGTGQHESTRLCLEALERVIAPGCMFLDLGCGSGILSIGALLLGADRAVMVDISENAVKVACENMEQNGFSADKFTAFCGDITKDTGLLEKLGENFCVITANIVADIIIKMCGIFPRLLKKDGILVTSGIIEARFDEVADALSGAGLKILETVTDNGWCMIKSSY